MSHTPEQPMKGVIGIIRRDGRLLMIQRSRHVRVPLAWCFPGGEIEDGETQPQALVREMQEEINVATKAGELLMTQEKHDGRLILYCWSASIISGEPSPNPREVAQVVWMTPDEIRRQEGLLHGMHEILEVIGR